MHLLTLPIKVHKFYLGLHHQQLYIMITRSLLPALLLLIACFKLHAQSTLYAGPDQTICAPNSATLTATIVPQAPIAYAPDSYTQGTLVPLSSDDFNSGLIPIGFNFCFMGNTYNQLVISTNNYITFDNSQANLYSPWSTVAVPNTTAPLNAIMGPWQDINPGIGGTIRYQVYGVAPYRHLTVSWYQIPMFSCTNLIYSSQIQIYETTGVIESHIDNRPICNTWNYGNAVHALHDATGTIADVVPGRNNTPWTVTNEGYRWTPQGVNPTINWYSNGVLVGTGLSITVTPPSGTTEYICQIDNSGGLACGAGVISDAVLVTVSNPVVTVTSQNADCITGVGGSMSATVAGAALPYNFSWNTVPPTNNATVTNVSPGTYTATLTDANGCVSTADVTITQQGSLVTQLVSTIDVSCNAQSNGNIEVVGSGTIGPYNYTLNGTTNTTGVFSNLTAGNYTVTITDGIGCTALQAAVVNEPASPLSLTQTAHNNLACFGLSNGSASFSASGGTSPYSFSNGIVTNSTGNFSDMAATNYVFSVTDANGCYVTLTDAITQPDLLEASISASNNIVCNGQTNGGATVDAVGGTLPYNYLWNDPLAQNTVTASGLSAGSYQVTVSDANGCTANAQVIITEPDAMVISISQDVDICEDDEIGLSVFSAGGTGIISFLWMPGNLTNDSIVVEPEVNTNYSVVATDANGCSIAADVDVFVNERPHPEIVLNSNVGCRGLCPTFTDVTPAPLNGSIVKRSWSFGDGVIYTDETLNTADHCYPGDGQFDVTLTVTTDKGCTATHTWNQMIEVYPTPKADFVVETPEVDIFNPLVSIKDLSVGAESMAWNFGDSDSLFSSQQEHHTYRDTGWFQIRLVVTSEYGCIDSTKALVRVNPYYTCFIPTSFTPNGDGLNDIFEINSAYVQNCNLQVFDRWGKLLYNKSGNSNVSWDGSNLPEGVYMYKLLMRDTKNKDYEYFGELTLLK